MKIYSLGMNCEVSFQIERKFGVVDSCLFSWAFVLDDYLFLDALRNSDDIFENEIEFHRPSDDMFIDKKYKIIFHGRSKKSELFDKEWNIINSDLYDETIDELKSRIRHLKNKWIKQIEPGEEKIYFIKKIWRSKEETGTGNRNEIIKYIVKLDELLQSISGNYQLVIVIDKDYYSEDMSCLENDRLKIRTVNFFSTWENTKFGADNESWDIILDELVDQELKGDVKNE